MENLILEVEKNNKQNQRNFTLESWGHKKVAELERAFNIDLQSVLFSNEGGYLKIKKQAIKVLVEGIDERNKKIGFTDLLSDGSEPVLTSVNMSMPMQNLKTISSYKGTAIDQYYKDQGDHLSQMIKETSTRAMAKKIKGAGLFNISNIASLTTANALLDEIPLIGSIVKGIEAVPGKFVSYISSAIISGIIWALGLRPSIVSGMIINGTDHNFSVINWQEHNKEGSDLYLNHGKLDDFMADHDSILLSSPDVQIMKRVDISETDEFEYMVFAGSYVARKDTSLGFGFYGTEGTMIFTNDSKKHPVKFAHQFAVPYSASNGTNIELLDNDDSTPIKDINDKLYDERDEYVSKTSGNQELTSSINGKHGQAGLILATITDTRLI
ncbi:hypothetical protein [Tenacibaculum ovolyticum]|uniref:hypothetical protein n=1 Tax=Tenacibaculum ovolyticum TaxID=104270 RepID=UPI0003FD4388|nr:hypothetical protein [Tenacibaculum ovolyticum]